jgi:DDE superfamily endonuclease
MWKDVECTFGIMKGRFRILKTGIRLHRVEATDKIWMTCCALHNYLLDVDGLNEGWESGVPSYWERAGSSEF